MQFTFALATIAAVAASVTASPVKRDGQATFYYGAGAAGSCGSSITDGDSVVAVAQSDMNSSNCGKSITVMNTSNGNTATATIQDTCPTCSSGSLDLSPSVFNQLGDESAGTLPITYWYN